MMSHVRSQLRPPVGRQQGVVLISALLLLIIMTILAMTMFRTNGVQEMIAGNVREKQRALQSAENAEQYAEIWLSSGSNALANLVDCSKLTPSTLIVYSSTSTPDLCAYPLTQISDALNVTTVPWKVNGNEIGFTFYPGVAGTSGTGDMSVSTAGGANNYYQTPRFYISEIAAGTTANMALYRIDAWNWGGTQNSVAVVESNYLVKCNVCPL